MTDAIGSGPADVVFVGGPVFTAVPGAPLTEAVAVTDGVVRATGTAAEIDALVGPRTRVVDAAGGLVMPGFVDAHNHVTLHGQAMLHEIAVPDTATIDEILETVRRSAQRPAGSDDWIVVSAYPSALFPRLGTADMLARLDAVSAGRPVIVRESSRHNRWVNTVAMSRAGIGPDSPDPAHGRIVRDAHSGALTGVLVEAAGIPVEHAFAAARPVSLEAYAARARRGIAPLSTLGVTAMHDAGSSEGTMAGTAALDRDGGLDAWVVSSILVHEQIFGFLPRGEELLDHAESFRTAHHRATFVKIFMDGIPPTRTASFLSPYRPTAEHPDGLSVAPLFDEDTLVEALVDAARRGLSAKMHCTGDGSVHTALDAIERVRALGFDETIYHVGHAQFIADADIPRFARLNAVVEISPYMWFPGPVQHAIDDLVRPGLAARMHPVRDLLDAGATVAVGSDWPAGTDPNPWHAVHGLVTRTDPTGAWDGVSAPDQAVTLAEALAMATRHGAQALGIADRTGTLEPGRSADLVVVEKNPFAVPPEDLHRMRVAQTWFAGRRIV